MFKKLSAASLVMLFLTIQLFAGGTAKQNSDKITYGKIIADYLIGENEIDYLWDSVKICVSLWEINNDAFLPQNYTDFHRIPQKPSLEKD